MRGATRCPRSPCTNDTYFNPRSSCEERHVDGTLLVIPTVISIHAPHARSDLSLLLHLCHTSIFQSTLLMRGATLVPVAVPLSVRLISIHAPHARSDENHPATIESSKNFNPRSSCEERRRSYVIEWQPMTHFNPRSSCEERRDMRISISVITLFQSTLLMRGATGKWMPSIGEMYNFNPRSSCEERRESKVTLQIVMEFQSTLLMRGATCQLS